MIDPARLKTLQAAAREYDEATAIVKRAVEGLADQPKKGIMPWEQTK